MTRLTEHDIAGMDTAWQEYERRLLTLAGTDLLTLAAQSLSMPAPDVTGMRVAAVPVSSGEGLIPGFAESLVSIARHLGFEAKTVSPDEAGFREARAFDLFIWADDDNYYAENVRTGTRAENGVATGRGFAEALLCLLRHERPLEQAILVLGAGPVGRAGAEHLARAGHDVLVCDLDAAKARQIASEHIHACTPEELPQRMPHILALLDAAPTSRCFPYALTAPHVCVAAPCVPCLWGEHLPPSARLWHDPLQLGTAVMLLAAAFKQPLLPNHN